MVTMNELPGLILIFGITIVFGVVMATLGTDLKNDQCANQTINASDSGAYVCGDTGVYVNITDQGALNFSINGLAGLTNVGSKLPLLGTIIILGAVIGIIIGVFRFKRSGF